MNKNTKYINYLPALLAVFIWSVNIIVMRYAVQFISPLSISIYRWVIAFGCLTPFALIPILKNRKQIYPYIWKLAILGFLGMFCYQGIAYIAAQKTTAINMGIMNGLSPIFTLLIAMLFLNTKLNLKTSIGATLSFIGVIIFLSQDNPIIVLQNGFNQGDYLMIIAVLAYAAYGVLIKYWKLPLTLLESLYIQIFFGLLYHMLLIFKIQLSPITYSNSWIFIFSGIFPSIIASFMWMKSITQIGAYKTSIIFNFLPIFVGLIAVIVLNEIWNLYNYIGLIIVLIGLYLTQKK